MNTYSNKKLIDSLSSLLAKVKQINKNNLNKADPPEFKSKKSDIVEQALKAPQPAQIAEQTKVSDSPALPETSSIDTDKKNLNIQRNEEGKLLVSPKKLTRKIAHWDGDSQFRNDPQLQSINALLMDLHKKGAPIEDLQEVLDHLDKRTFDLRKEHARIKGFGFNENTGEVFEPQVPKLERAKKSFDWKPSFNSEWLGKLSVLPLEEAKNRMIMVIAHGNFPEGKVGVSHKSGWAMRIANARNMQELLNVGRDHLLNPQSGAGYVKKIVG